jgi:hypothetical protein
MARLPATAEVVPIERHWRRHALAAAATVLLALGATLLYVQQRGIDPVIGSDRAEQILAEVEATLDSDQIPGFETLDETFFAADDTEEALDGDSDSAWDVALAALEDDQVNYEVPGFEALGMLVPTVDDLESMMVDDSESDATKRRKRA